MLDRDRLIREQRHSIYQPSAAPGGSPATLGKVTTANSLIAVGKFLDWHPVTILGSEVEGGAASLTVNTNATRSAVLLGGSAQQNDILIFDWNDWRWTTSKGGNACAWVFTISGCTSALAGATVSLYKSGVLIASGVSSDGTGGTTLGQVRFSVPQGTYNVQVSGPSGSGFAGYSNNLTFTCSGSNDVNVPITLTAATGFLCTNCCNYPVPNALQSTDGNGTHTLTWNFNGWYSPWIDSGFPGYSVDPNGCCVANGNCQYRLILFCSSGVWTLVVDFGEVICTCDGVCVNPGGMQYAGGQFSNGGPSANASLVECSPFALSFNMPTTVSHDVVCGNSTLATLGGGGAMDVTA